METMRELLIKSHLTRRRTGLGTDLFAITGIGVFHAMAGMAAAMPGLKKFPSAGKEIEANR